MSEPSIHELLTKNFSSVGKDEWLHAASSEMPQQNSVENLLWGIDGLTFAPYYVKDDVRDTAYLQRFHYRSNELVNNSWLNVPVIKVIDENEANGKALAFLQRGADGIILDVSDINDLNVAILLDKIRWDLCTVSFRTSDTKVATKILAYAEEKKYHPANILGSIWWRDLPESRQLVKIAEKFFAHFRKYQPVGIEVPLSSPVKEISGALQIGVQLIDEMTDLGLNREAAFRSVSLSFMCDENFLVNIVKLKTIRMLWYQLSQSFEVTDYSPSNLHVHCRTGNLVDEKFQPHGHMIKNSLQAISGILGGCNAIAISGDGSVDSMTDRVALNVSNILKAESHLDKVADPVAGSYTIERMVHEFSQAAWQDFQKLQP